jgi:signal peptide peptidase-like protein 2B
MLSNIIALCIILTLFNVVKLDNMKVGALLLILAFFYDIFWVFYSS